jgi:hypothetical protein
MSNGIYETVLTFPDPDAQKRYAELVGLDATKERLEKESEVLLRPDLLEAWSKEHHGGRIGALDDLLTRPPLFIFEGDVGTGKTELSMSFGDPLARAIKGEVQLFSLSLRARGQGHVGEMTTLIADAVKTFLTQCPKLPAHGKKPVGAAILLIDEADAIAQSREAAQMHHEDRAGVNALIRGIDDIGRGKLAGLIVLCTNRVSQLDPAIRRRSASRRLLFSAVRVPRLRSPPPEGRGGRDSKRGDEGSRWSLPARWRRLVSGFVGGVSVVRCLRFAENLKSQFAISKTNLLAGWFRWRSHQLANGFEDDIELLAMLLIAPFQVRDLAGKLIYGKNHLPQTDKSFTSEPCGLPCCFRRDQFPVMAEDHFRRIARFQRHPRRVMQDGQPVRDERMAQAVLGPGKSLAQGSCRMLRAVDAGKPAPRLAASA